MPPKNEKRETRDEKRSFHVSGFSFLVLLMMALRASAQAAAADIYISQVGGGNGSSCSSAQNAAFFNNPSNWGSGASQIGPGTTVHLCGTFTGGVGATMLTFQAGGSSGNPITLKFEPNAVLTAPYWSTSTGAINVNNKMFIAIDGGTNGLITCTDNGTGKTYQVEPIGIYGGSGAVANLTIQNVTITNIYLRKVGDTSTTGFNSAGIYAQSAGNLRICNNTVHDVKTGISVWWQSTISNDVICNNTVYNRDAGVIYASAGGTATGSQIYGNSIGDAVNWDTPSDTFHHDGIHVWGTNGTSGLLIYDNNFYGDVGGFSTAQVFIEDLQLNPKIFNNVFTTTNNSAAANASVTIKGATGALVANNTFLSTTGQAIQYENSASGGVVKNNVISGYGIGLFVADSGSGTGFTANNNVYNPASINFCWESNCSFLNFAQWKAASGSDAVSVTADPKLTVDGHLQSGSPAIGLGINLTNLNLATLDSDKSGTARPISGAWDIGAYQFESALNTPCDMNGDGTVNVADVQTEINMALGKSTCTNPSGTCNVTSVQKVINAVLGGACVTP